MTNQVPPPKPVELTPKHLRAARALLAWSQQDLAKKANVAASTVADFERGHRTPVPNNIDAMRLALEQAGITFLPGGAIIGPSIPGLARTNRPGSPVRWVDATDLAQWAERRDGQGTLPRLLAHLVEASGPIALHFPADEGIQHAGWDGTTDTVEGTEYVPAGPAGWEIGTQRDRIAAKASEDFEKRTANPAPLVASKSTFVFVTPRHWPAKEQWASEKRQLGHWRDVRAYDGTDLVHWLERNPAVAQWLASHLGKRPPGVRQLSEAWQEWSLATKWPLMPELVLSDRDEDAIALLQWLRTEPSVLALQAETVDEAVAFVFAVTDQLPSEVADHYRARTLVVASAEAARTLSNSTTSQVIILMDPEPGLAQLMASRGHHVLLAYSSGAAPAADMRKLARPSRDGIERALIDMEIAEVRAKTLARDSSRSLAILRRLVPQAPGRLPKWAQDRPPHALLAALLAGAWDETSDGDRAILARLANEPYDELATELTAFAGDFDLPLRKVGSTWKVASPPDAWLLLAQFLSSSDINTFEAIAIDVLGAADPRYKLAPDERWYAPIRGIKPEFSGFLCRGLGEILIMLALFGDRAHTVTDTQSRAERIVRKLLHGADAERWWSLSDDFQLLAEASPEAFLAAIEDSLSKDEPSITALFGTDKSPLFGGEHLSDLLWALESLAWSPRYLARVSLILAQLDTLDDTLQHDKRYGNRPGNSLRQIFLLWSPQTNATLDERLRVLDRIRKDWPRAAWKLMRGTLPSGHDSFSPSPPTRWRDFSTDNREIVTYALIGRGAEALTERLLADVETNPHRWISLLERISDLAPNPEGTIDKLAATVTSFTVPEDRMVLWEGLRGVLNHHRWVPDANWALPEELLTKLEAVYNSLAPTDLLSRYAWLFQITVNLPDPTPGGWRSDDMRVREARQNAAKELLDTGGIDKVFELARTLEMAGYLGQAIVEGSSDAATVAKILICAVNSENDRERQLAHGMIVTLFQTLGQPWAEKLLATAKAEKWGQEAVLTILRALPSNKWTWERAKQAGKRIEKQFWERAPILWIDDDIEQVIFAVEKLFSVRRAHDAVHLIGRDLKKQLPTDLLVRVLEAAQKEPWIKGDNRNDATMFQHHVAEILRRLDEDHDTPEQTMLALEWGYMPLLEYSRRPAKVLLKALSEQPRFFIEVLSAVFKPSEGSGVVETIPTDRKRAQAIASQAYDLLRLWNRIPGTRSDGTIDEVALGAWIDEARTLAKAAGREEIADSKIGEMLSASLRGEDGAWPAIPVREVIERLRSANLENGFVVGKHNRRGVTSRLPRDGGAQERDLVNQFRNDAKLTALDWPRTSGVLETLAKRYEVEARRHDEAAERVDW